MVHHTAVLEVVSRSKAKMNDAPQNLSHPYSPFLGIFLHREGWAHITRKRGGALDDGEKEQRRRCRV